MAFSHKGSKGKVKVEPGALYTTGKKGVKKPVNSLAEALAEEAKCGGCGCSKCDCWHYVLGSLDDDPDTRLYLWNDAGVFTTGTEAEFKAACDAAKNAETK